MAARGITPVSPTHHDSQIHLLPISYTQYAVLSLRGGGGVRRILLAFTRYSFTSRLLCTKQLYPFLPPAYLHCPPWCNTIARLLDSIRFPFQPPVCLLYTIQYWQSQYLVKAKACCVKGWVGIIVEVNHTDRYVRTSG